MCHLIGVAISYGPSGASSYAPLVSGECYIGCYAFVDIDRAAVAAGLT